VFRSKKTHQRIHFILRKDLLEAGHLLTAIQYLMAYLLRLQSFTDICERGASSSPCRGRSVAISATLIAEQVRPGLLRFLL